MLDIDSTYEIKHVQAKELDKGDPQGRGFLSFDTTVLARLLFCDTYAIDEMSLKEDVLTLAVHHTGPATPRGSERHLVWDIQQRPGHGGCGVVSLNVVALEREDEQNNEGNHWVLG